MRLADVDPGGRLRLDAVARYLQDVAADDLDDAGCADEYRWVVRTTAVRVRHAPRYGDTVEARTWCSGTGAAWAQRRTDLAVGASVAVEADSLWVALDPATMHPTPVGGEFAARYVSAAGGRRVGSRLTHPRPGPGATRTGTWRLRWSDLDVLGHVNNAVAWVALEDVAGRLGARIAAAEVEYPAPIETLDDLDMVTEVTTDGLRMWLCAAGAGAGGSGDGQVAVSILVRWRSPP